MAHGLVLERAREPRAVPGPRNRTDHDAVTAAGHPRRVGLDERQRAAEIQRTPTPAPTAEVIPRAASPADPATLTLAPRRPDRHDDLVLTADLHVLDDRPLDAQQPHPYPELAHVVSAPLDSSPEEAGTLGSKRRAPFYSDLTNPREQQERPISPTQSGKVRAVPMAPDLAAALARLGQRER
jgi:hypothetical protein